MAMVIQLTVLLATSLIHFALPPWPDCKDEDVIINTLYPAQTLPNLQNCKLSNGKKVNLQIRAQSLDHCMLMNCSVPCLKIKYKSISSPVILELEKVCKSSSQDTCDGKSTSTTCQINITGYTNHIIFTGQKTCISLPTDKHVNIKMTFQCIPEGQPFNTPADDDKRTSLHFYTEPKSWNDALEHCQTQNSSLVQITNETVKDDVYLVWQDDNSSQAGVWIGLERSIFGNNPEWKWISGSKLMHSQLNSSFPVNPLNNHCGKIIIDDESEEFKWQDADCHSRLPYICQGSNQT